MVMVVRSPVCSLSHPVVEQEGRLGIDGACSSAGFRRGLSGSGRTSKLVVAVELSLLSPSLTHRQLSLLRSSLDCEVGVL